MMRLAMMFAAAFLAASPASAKTDKSLKYLEKAARRAGSAVADRLTGKVGVLDFTETASPDSTSEFGQKAAELVAARLVERAKGRYRLVERRELIRIARDSILIAGDDEEVFKRIRAEAGMDVLVTGTYNTSGSEASVIVKAVDVKTMIVLAETTVRLPRGEALDRMIARRMEVGKSAPPEDPPKKTGETTVLDLDAGLFYEGGDGRLYPVREGMVLNSKDNYALYLKPSQVSYLYVYQVDSTQKAFKIFPNADYSKAVNPLRPGELWVPDGGEFLFLDENPGREELYVFATRAPMPQLEKLEQAKLSDIQASIRTMGIAGRRGSQVVEKVRDTHGNPMEMITRKLYAQGDFFWRIAFIHQ